jgi:hypothetical protein
MELLTLQEAVEVVAVWVAPPPQVVVEVALVEVGVAKVLLALVAAQDLLAATQQAVEGLDLVVAQEEVGVVPAKELVLAVVVGVYCQVLAALEDLLVAVQVALVVVQTMLVQMVLYQTVVAVAVAVGAHQEATQLATLATEVVALEAKQLH